MLACLQLAPERVGLPGQRMADARRFHAASSQIPAPGCSAARGCSRSDRSDTRRAVLRQFSLPRIVRPEEPLTGSFPGFFRRFRDGRPVDPLRPTRRLHRPPRQASGEVLFPDGQVVDNSPDGVATGFGTPGRLRRREAMHRGQQGDVPALFLGGLTSWGIRRPGRRG